MNEYCIFGCILLISILVFCLINYLNKKRIQQETVTRYTAHPEKVYRRFYTISFWEYASFEIRAYQSEFVDYVEDIGSSIYYHIEKDVIYPLTKYAFFKMIFKKYPYRYFRPMPKENFPILPQKRIFRSLPKKYKGTSKK